MPTADTLLKGVSILVFAGLMLGLSIVILDEFIDTQPAKTTSALNGSWKAMNRSWNFTITNLPVQSGSVKLYNMSGYTIPTSNYTVYYSENTEHNYNKAIIVKFNGGVSDTKWRNKTVSVNYTRLNYGEEVATLNKTLVAFGDMGEWMGTIVLVVCAAIIIGLVFYMVGWRGGSEAM